jgi:predicted Zn-dependent protease
VIFSLSTPAVSQSRTLASERLGLWEQTFHRLSDALQAECRADEHFSLSLVAEDSQFTRMNRARVRQSGEVVDGALKLNWIARQRTCYRDLPFTGNWQEDWATVKPALAELRAEIDQLPEDPFIVLPQRRSGSEASSRAVYRGELLPRDQAIAQLLGPVQGLDFVGIYAAGLAVRAQSDSAGQRHWFATESFTLDYSLFDLRGQAVKGTFADRSWEQSAYEANVTRAKQQLQLMDRPVKALPKGQYRTYLAPAAMSELILMMSWSCISEAAIRQGGSPMEQLRLGQRQLSPRLTLRENFSRGLVPQFNSDSEMAPNNLPLIERGRLVNTTINGRTAQEYGVVSNGASDSEDLRAAEVDGGDLAEAEILQALDTGLYLSNLHYLNWSDRPAGRITGMTRYACFWVEAGEIVAPIHDLRFDETLFNFWGDNLIALTAQQELVPAVDTYEHRDLGGTWTPGALIEDFTYTL